MPPYRLNVPNAGGADHPASGGASNPKKRRKNGAASQPPQPQPPTNVQDLLPPPLSGYGDTIVASNPFDDCPSSMTMSMVRNPNPMGMPPGKPMDMYHMNMCRPMGGPPMPNMHGHGMMMNGSPRMNGPPLNGPPMGPNGPMGPQMIPSPNGPGSMHGPIPGPMQSPLGNMGPSPGMPGPINGPMMSPMGGPMNNGGPMGGPIHSPHNPMNGPMNSPMSGHGNGPGPGPPGPGPGPPTAMNGMSSPMGNQMNGMGPGNMNNPMGGPPNPCNMNHNSGNGPMNNNFMMPMYQKPMPVSAGKVYPADQPMVFNSQNPNAPPIYPCGVCHKEVHDNDQAILCESGCNFWFHRACTGLTEAAFSMLTNEVYAEWVCDKCLNTKTIPLVKFKP